MTLNFKNLSRSRKLDISALDVHMQTNAIHLFQEKNT